MNTASGGLGLGSVITIVLAILKLLAIPSMANVPWWSFNPLELSVFIMITWTLYLVVGFLLVLGVVMALSSTKRQKRGPGNGR